MTINCFLFFIYVKRQNKISLIAEIEVANYAMSVLALHSTHMGCYASQSMVGFFGLYQIF
ncbi:hypothetical protein BIY29_04455 [Brenneria alni]|uniref:Uncharacterized protein n=1 Tax=Brenneria alni TaxID=71656 RepID=A0A421DRS3_9GAMM|nr:hypothetical protein BIY29_04455 [Brenneria alni]